MNRYDIRSWHKTDMAVASFNVRDWGKGGYAQDVAGVSRRVDAFGAQTLGMKSGNVETHKLTLLRFNRFQLLGK